MSLLSQKDAAAVEAAIGKAEQRSAGEVVVGCVARSDSYAVPRALCAALWTVAVTWLVHHVYSGLPFYRLLLGQLPLGLLAYLALGLPVILRPLAGKHACAQATRARAMQMFAQRGVHNTREHTGLLIFISELEHQVVILGDRGIDAHLGAKGYADFVAKITAGIRANTLATNLVEVIDACGKLLAKHYPKRADDKNELPDAVVRH
jgi:putative membrane protein